MKTYGILAFPAKYSLSPVMHNAAFKEMGVDAQYDVFDVAEAEFVDFMARMKSEPISGLSVSLPYKEVIMAHLDEIDEGARNIGAVNTVVNVDGKLVGYNTDFIGAMQALDDARVLVEGRNVTVVGAGGASRAVVYGLLKNGANVSIYNRGAERARGLAEEFSELLGVRIESGDLDEMRSEASGDILIQTSSIWTLSGEITAEDVEKMFPKDTVDRFSVVMDIAYNPLLTPLLKAAQDLGKIVITGEKMLLFQACEQFELWTGKKAPVEVMRKVLEENL